MTREDDRKTRLHDWRYPDEPPLVLLSALNLLGIAAFIAAVSVFGFIVVPWLWEMAL